MSKLRDLINLHCLCSYAMLSMNYMSDALKFIRIYEMDEKYAKDFEKLKEDLQELYNKYTDEVQPIYQELKELTEKGEE